MVVVVVVVGAPLGAASCACDRQKTLTATEKPIEVTLWNQSAGMKSTSPGPSSHSDLDPTARRHRGNSSSFHWSIEATREEEPST